MDPRHERVGVSFKFFSCHFQGHETKMQALNIMKISPNDLAVSGIHSIKATIKGYLIGLIRLTNVSRGTMKP